MIVVSGRLSGVKNAGRLRREILSCGLFASRRIFVTSAFKLWTTVVGIIILIWHGSFIGAFVFQCIPVSAAWDFIAPSIFIDRITQWLTLAMSDILTEAPTISETSFIIFSRAARNA